MPPRRWLVTGVSGGLGRAIAEHALGRGDTVIGTLRREDQCAGFAALAPSRAFPLRLDIADDDSAPAVTRAVSTAGGIDILVNNAGYCLLGAIEDMSLDEARREMEVNFFGALKMIQVVTPHLRRQGRGHIVNIASVAGAAGFPLFGLYSASKFAIVGLSAALAKELAPFGVHVTAVEPGGLRTNFGGPSLHVACVVSPPYRESVQGIVDRLASGRRTAVNDPAKAAAAIATLIDMENPPVHAALGPDGLRSVRAALEARLMDYARAGPAMAETLADG